MLHDLHLDGSYLSPAHKGFPDDPLALGTRGLWKFQGFSAGYKSQWHQGFEKVPLLHFNSLDAPYNSSCVFTGRCTCALNILVPQFAHSYVHSLHSRPLLEGPQRRPLALFRTTLWTLAQLLLWQDATSKHLRIASLSGSGPVSPDGCMCFVKRLGGLTEEVDTNNPTVETCVDTCVADPKNYTQAGVSGKYCCTCFTILFDEHSSTNQTSLSKTVINLPTGGILYPRKIARS